MAALKQKLDNIHYKSGKHLFIVTDVLINIPLRCYGYVNLCPNLRFFFAIPVFLFTFLFTCKTCGYQVTYHRIIVKIAFLAISTSYSHIFECSTPGN